ncbi:MAG: DUF393 domain-containing protein [Alphaproteobacteria bacterium]|nr:DUF393 domain-containing protein [Alphaproteobacteria bacterium]
MSSLSIADIAEGEGRPPAALTVFFDGACPLCRREISFYRNRSRGVEFIDVSTADLQSVSGLSHENALARFHVRTASGVMIDGAAAFAALWRQTPGLFWLGRLFGRQPLLGIAEVAYRAFLVMRPVVHHTARLIFRDEACENGACEARPAGAAQVAGRPGCGPSGRSAVR